MPSPIKLLLLVLVAVAAWYGYRWWKTQSAGKQLGARKPSEIAEDMQPCRVCGTYVAARSAAHCGRADCPFPRRAGGQ